MEEGWESKHNNGPVTNQEARILLQVFCPQRKSGLLGSPFDKQKDCLTVNAMAYYRHLFVLYIHCSSQRCVKQRRVDFRGMGKAERHPVVRVHRSEPVQWSEWQQSQFFIPNAPPPTCVLTTQSTKYRPHTKTEKIIFEDKILWSARQQMFLQVHYSFIFLGNVILICKSLSHKGMYITHYKSGVNKFFRNL